MHARQRRPPLALTEVLETYAALSLVRRELALGVDNRTYRKGRYRLGRCPAILAPITEYLEQTIVAHVVQALSWTKPGIGVRHRLE